jgi:hypothetical protein
MKRIPFHFGLFYHAMIGFLGREPDIKHCFGDTGFYQFKYFPKNEEEKKSLSKAACTLAQWLDNFEILFSDSRCTYGTLDPNEKEKTDILYIVISSPIEKKA